MKKLNRQRKGYILVELLVSVVILSTGILFLIDSMRASFKVAQRMQATEQALAVATETFHQLTTDQEGSGLPQSGKKKVGDIIYKWEVREKHPLLLEGFASETKLLSLRVGWHDEKDYAIELPFLWCEGSGSQPVPALH